MFHVTNDEFLCLSTLFLMFFVWSNSSTKTSYFGIRTTFYKKNCANLMLSTNRAHIYLLKVDSHLLPPKKSFNCSKKKPCKNCEKHFLFHLKSSFRFQDVYSFILTFPRCRKTSFNRKIWLILKFTTSQPGSLTNNYNTYIVQYLMK